MLGIEPMPSTATPSNTTSEGWPTTLKQLLKIFGLFVLAISLLKLLIISITNKI